VVPKKLTLYYYFLMLSGVKVPRAKTKKTIFKIVIIDTMPVVMMVLLFDHCIKASVV